jgi:hydroxymethylpyrimidine pyrophosphatase-like HAD family hydrolase
MIKLIATDMDGTFLRDDLTYDEARFVKLQQRLQQRNIRFVVASGNQYFQLKSFFRAYPETIYVAENGAYIRDQERIYALHSFTDLAVKQILDKLARVPDLNIIVCGQNSAYILDSVAPAYVTKMRQYYYRLAVVPDFAHIDDRIVKFALGCPPAQTTALVAQLRQTLAGLAEPTSSGHGDIDLI